ncbi:alpha-(1,3)-fucosyltransferase C-like isoform X2 [Pecten maximus]|uniref:alpha-(1,3)-fucosyltransferase C-like isoform X2 n=1 Tax=Pecten maximus TaxID=6579 RepID=UPI0014581AD8|nr:alpha-(1,3)-fucosyltransferase C-like isoform X2 [Pecten maximus]
MNKIKLYRKYVLTFIIVVTVKILCETWSISSYKGGIQDQPLVIIHKTSHWVNKTTKTVLVWTEFFADNTWVESFKDAFQQCKFKCVATSDKADIKSADAVIFHLRDINSRPPDYRDKSQVWIAINSEAPTHITPNYYLKQVNGMFNWTMSYRRDSTVKNYYGRFRRLTRDEQTKYVHTDYATTKSKMAVSIVSNCDDNADRQKILTELGRYVELDQYGNCGYLDCPRTDTPTCTSSAYRYRIALENSICQDYITEKFWNSLNDDVIPVVNWPWIDTLVTKELVPPKSFINLYDFKSVADLGKYLNYLAGNYSEYNSYFEWKKQYRLWDSYMSFIDLCTELHQPRRDQEIPNLFKWLQNDTKTCKRDPALIRAFRRMRNFLWG